MRWRLATCVYGRLRFPSIASSTPVDTVEMKLTIIAPDMVYEHEVDSSMQVQDIIALVEAEVSLVRFT